MRADVDRLGQVMNNLLSNAARYSAGDSDIRITAHVVDECVEVQVSDRGMGVAPEDCERIFEKFYRGRHGATLATPSRADDRSRRRSAWAPIPTCAWPRRSAPARRPATDAGNDAASTSGRTSNQATLAPPGSPQPTGATTDAPSQATR